MIVTTKSASGKITAYHVANPNEVPARTEYRFMDKGTCKTHRKTAKNLDLARFLSNSQYNYVYWDNKELSFFRCRAEIDYDVCQWVYYDGLNHEVHREFLSEEEKALLGDAIKANQKPLKLSGPATCGGE